jgi:hypothetical protein
MNDKWVKLFMSTSTQTLVTILKEGSSYEVVIRVIKGGETFTESLYSGDNAKGARKVFDSVDREVAIKFVDNVDAVDEPVQLSAQKEEAVGDQPPIMEKEEVAVVDLDVSEGADGSEGPDDSALGDGVESEDPDSEESNPS